MSAEADADAGAGAGAEADPAGAGACLNCGQELAGPFCAQCGQRAGGHRSLRGLVEELVYNLIHLDGKIWRTLPLLIYRPGMLTREYVHGRRARYVSPLALYLFVIFITFFGLGIASGLGSGGASPPAPLDGNAATQAADEAPAPADDAMARTAAALRAQAEAETDPDAARRAITAAEAIENARDDILENGPPGAEDIDTGSATMDALILRAVENPQLTLYRFQNAVARYSFLLVPISLPFMWLLFAWRRDVNLFDHCVFILYSLSFMCLLFLAATLVGRIPGLASLGALALFFGPPAHILVQMKGAYRLGWAPAILRTVAVLFIALIALTVFLIFALAVGLMG